MMKKFLTSKNPLVLASTIFAVATVYRLFERDSLVSSLVWGAFAGLLVFVLSKIFLPKG
jgi:hypothetical protein